MNKNKLITQLFEARLTEMESSEKYEALSQDAKCLGLTELSTTLEAISEAKIKHKLALESILTEHAKLMFSV